ncbi:MAG: head GIN domain-containing protein [Telluria sp.]
MKTTSKTALILRSAVLAAAVFGLAAPARVANAAPFDWIAGEKARGNGAVKRQARPVAHFTGLSLSLPAQVELRIGNTESVTIETDDNLLPLIETAVENGTLKLRPVKRNMRIDASTLKIVVQARALDRIALGGSGSIRSAALRGGKMQFDLGGSGSIDVQAIEAESVAVTVGGSGNLKAGGGRAQSVSVSIGGSGDVDLGRLAAGQASVSVAGSGTATVWARDALSATIAGSGDVNYYGDPRVSRSVIGSGDVERLGGAPR